MCKGKKEKVKVSVVGGLAKAIKVKVKAIISAIINALRSGGCSKNITCSQLLSERAASLPESLCAGQVISILVAPDL